MVDEGGERKAPSSYEIFILAISVLSILNIVLFLLPIGDESRGVIVIVEFVLSFFFLGDFAYRFATAPNRRDYLSRRWGWADFLGSLPFTGLRIFRLLRMVRVVRILTRYGLRNTVRSLRYELAGSAMAVVLILVFVVLEAAAISVLRVESEDASANIRTASDAVWWGVVTIATVGYGDRYPVTGGGRVIGFVLIVVGVGLFGVLTGYLANRFIQPAPMRARRHEDDPGSTLAEIRGLLDEQDQRRAALVERLDQLERQIRRGVQTGNAQGDMNAEPRATAEPGRSAVETA
jgi:voltage-gated potassium channel